MKVTSHEYEDRPGMLVIELRDDIEARYGSQVAPGIHLHYVEAEDGGRIPVFVEIEVWDERVLFEHRRDGRASDPETIKMAAILSALESVEVSVEKVKGAIVDANEDSECPETKR